MNPPLWNTRPAASPPDRRPCGLLSLLEGRALIELLSVPVALPWLLRQLPRGDGHPVLVLPGLMASDASTLPLRQFLRLLGYDAQGWALGRNLGLREDLQPRLADRLQQLHAHKQRTVSVIGWSLGGVFARELARQWPALTRQVISLGSPLYGTPAQDTHPLVWQLFKALNPHFDTQQANAVRGQTPPPVPTTSIYTRSDSVVGWGSSVEYGGPATDNVEVNTASHLGLGVNPLVWYVIGDRLAQAEGQWTHFKPEGLARRLYPGHPPERPAPPPVTP